jgi:streptogramin lyase
MKRSIVIFCALTIAGCGTSGTPPTVAGAGIDAAASPAARPLRLRTFQAGKAGLPLAALPWDLAGASDGSIWFTDTNTSTPTSPAIGRVDAVSGTISEYRTGLRAGAIPFAIVAGSDGNVWFSDTGNGAIGKVTPSGKISEFENARTSGSEAIAITESRNAIWSLDVGSTSYLVRSSFAGTIRTYAIPSGLVVSPYSSLVADAAGNLWFVALDLTNNVILAERRSNGSFHKVSTGLQGWHEPCCPNVAARNMYAANDGTLWFTTLYYGSQRYDSNPLGALQSSRVRYYMLRDVRQKFESFPSGVASDGGSVWVSGGSFGKVKGTLFRMQGDGSYSSFGIPLNPVDLAFSRGSKHRLWFTSYFPGVPGAITEVLDDGATAELRRVPSSPRYDRLVGRSCGPHNSKSVCRA